MKSLRLEKHVRHHLTDVPPQLISAPDCVLRTNQSPGRGGCALALFCPWPTGRPISLQTEVRGNTSGAGLHM